MKNLQLTLLNSIKLLKAKIYRKDIMLPVPQLGSLNRHWTEINSLSLGRIKRLSDRFRVSHNFVQFVLKVYRHHGSEYTIK